MLQQDRPDDYVVATGRATSVYEFCELAFTHAGLKAKNHVVVDPRFLRPAQFNSTPGNPAKARRQLGWGAETSLEVRPVAEMVEADLARVKQNKYQ